MSEQSPTIRTGITSRPRATAIPSLVQPAIEPGIIQVALTIMELATPSIPVHVEDSIITIAMDIRLMFRNETYGNYEESGSSNHKE
jgi:hypothetical protein